MGLVSMFTVSRERHNMPAIGAQAQTQWRLCLLILTLQNEREGSNDNILSSPSSFLRCLLTENDTHQAVGYNIALCLGAAMLSQRSKAIVY
jgi:hypothetical protein